MKGKLALGFLGVSTVVVALLAAHGSAVEAQPVASIALPQPSGTVQLYPGCNNIALTFPEGTASQMVVQAVTPAGAVQSMWRHNAAQNRFEGFSPAAPQASDLLTVNALDAVWLCVAAIAPPAAVPTTTPPAAGAMPEETLTVMTYNILDGGGVGPTDPKGDWCCGPPRGCCNAPGGNRLPRILEVIRRGDPDILGIQEAYLWQLDDHAIAREVAAELNMNYFIGESGSPDGAHVALFTKFDIKGAESYPTEFSASNPRGALHAELVTHSGQSVHVFVVHLKREAPQEVPVLVKEMSPYLGSLTVLLGDMNFEDPSDQASVLREAGWYHPLAEQQGIDQIWTSPALAPHVQPALPIPAELTAGTSDHLPVVVEIGIPSP